MVRAKDMMAWLAAAVLACSMTVVSSAQSNRRAPERQNRPNNQSHPDQNRPNNQAVPRPPRNETPSQGHHAGQWLRRYQGVPFDQQKKALESDPAFRRLPAERQERLQQRLQRFNSLPPERQQRILNRMEVWEHLTPDQKSDARRVFTGIRGLPPERRQAMQNAINALRAMPPGARERAIQSGRFSSFSPQERELLDGAAKLPLAPSEGEQTPEQ
jgi:hypothetical protein